MRLSISRKRGIRLFISKTRYIKVHNVLLLLALVCLSIFVVVGAFKGLIHECKCSKRENVELVFVESANNTEEDPVGGPIEEPVQEETVKEVYTGVCAYYYDMVDKYDWDTETMLAIMYAESTCIPTADNTGLNKNGSVDYGLFQINSIHGYDKEDLMDPEFNIEAAYRIYKMQGLKAWSVYKSGKYLQYLEK